ncbi:MAG: 3-isopropylmalate dehydratase small subunit [Desulfobacterales bacterium]|nr:3-isopropylmalate dehydratase small subunit [Desulfobacterales bacterium]
MKRFGGKVLFLDRSDINTDEIIPARYLTEPSRESLKPYLLEDIQLEGFSPTKDLAGKGAIVTRANFGCGSSREHAAWALEVNGIELVAAESFARIFRQNMFNCGMLAVSLSPEIIDRLFAEFSGKETEVAVDLEAPSFTFTADGSTLEVPFTLSRFEGDLIEAGGWVELADARY